MKFRAKVAQFTETDVPFFGPDPEDPLNTVSLGNTQQVTLEIVPGPQLIGYYGMGSFQLTLPLEMRDQLKPGDTVTIEITKEDK